MEMRFALLVSSLSLFILHPARGGDQVCFAPTKGGEQPAFTFYRNYRVSVPRENYIAFCARGFVPDDYLILDLKQKEARIYSPYQEVGLIHAHRISATEYEMIMNLLASDQVRKIPERNDKMAYDAFEFSAYGVIGKNTVKFHHILPDNETVLALYDVYKYFRDTKSKKK